ncbi:MAG TPA: hypothetical protein VGE09_11410 [Pseudoxanthomonas sp.]
MTRRRKPIRAFGVFNPEGRIETTKHTESEAEDAARIIGGTKWRSDGYRVEPVEVARVVTRSSTHKDMIE